MNVKTLRNQQVRDYLNFQRKLLVLVFFLLSSFGAQAQTITTDKDDYSPGQYVIVTGTGWTPGETVSFDFHETPQVCTSDHHIRSTIANADGNILYDQFLINEKHLGVSFVLTATGQSGATAVTYFTDAGIRNVLVDGTSFCAGQAIIVKFEAISAGAGGAFKKGNIFTAQLSNASGIFSAPTNIGTLDSDISNLIQEIEATIPTNVTPGAAYKIRVISSDPLVNSGTIINSASFSIFAKPTDANAGPDQSNITGTSTTLAANAPTVGTGEWSIVSGTGGSFGTTATSTSSIPIATFNGSVGVTYTLRWTITNGSCASFDETEVQFNQISTSTTAGSATATYGDNTVTLSATVLPNPGSGAVDFYVNGSKVGTGSVRAGGIATYIYDPSALNASSATINHTIQAKFIGSGSYTASNSGYSSFTVTKASSTTVVTIATGPFTYTGSAITPATVHVTGAGGLNLTPAAVYANNVNAGTATASYNYMGDGNYEPSSDSKTFAIGKADATITIDGYEGIYDGTSHGATGTATGVKGEDLSASLNLGASFTDAPGGTSSWSFVGGTNYNDENGTAEIAINKATPAFTSLGSSSINCGFETVTLSGKVAKGTLIPTGVVSITLNSFVQTASILPDGSFSATFNTGGLGASSTAYTISYEYNGDVNFNGITDNSTGVTVNSVLVDANANSTPQAVKTTATTIAITVTNTTRAAAASIPVTVYFDDREPQVSNTNASGIATFNVGVLPTGVYKIRVVAGAGCDETVVYLPIYDPEGGFVTGGGWIDSPAGAYKAMMELTGKANFGFVAKYKKGTTVPDGQTQFQFHAGELNFHSSAYDDMRLVIAGAKANYKGVGTINGTGNYGFMVSVVDGQVTGGGGVDKFRIKIWDKNNSDAVVYDNNITNTDENAEPATAIAGGSIVIHEMKSTGTTSTTRKLEADVTALPKSATKFSNYPNPYNERTTITFSTEKEESFALEVYDVKGALVKKVDMGVTEAGKVYEYDFESRNLPQGVYFARLITASDVQTIKMVLKR